MDSLKTKSLIEVGSSNIHFPTWEDVCYDFIKTYQLNNPDISFNEFLNSFFEKIAKLKELGFGDHIAQTMQIALDANCFSKPQVGTKDIDLFTSKIHSDLNEFYSLFELNKGDFCLVDPRITEVLGISQSEFTIPGLFAADPKNPLYHPDDVSHIIRWAGIAYCVLGFPGFNISSNREYYKISFRIPTETSQIEYYKKKKHILLEKKCFLKASDQIANLETPRYHFDKWTIYDATKFEFVFPEFISTNDQSELFHSLAFLMNASILNLSTKYVLFTEGRIKGDRNKEVAFCINEELQKRCRIKTNFQENQIADTFTKSIRSKIYNLCKMWDPIGNFDLITSEKQSVDYLKRFGLLPIPETVKQLIYKNIRYM